jgi:HSP20 family molecular chaperone IbpA
LERVGVPIAGSADCGVVIGDFADIYGPFMTIRPDPEDRMWSQACALIAEAERLHRQFFRLAAVESAPAWEPPIDVFEDEREIVVLVAMPGVAAERVQVSHDGGTLVVRGTRPLPFDGASFRIRQLEIPYGAFERRFTMPPGTFDVGRPELVQGCLVLRLRKRGR